MASLQARLMKFLMRKLRSRAMGMLNDLDMLRIEKERTFSRMRPPHNIQTKSFKVEHVEAEWVIPNTMRYPHKVLLYLHGGGYASGSIISHRGLVGKLAVELGVRAIGINYRLAPENPYPAALDDAMLMYRWLLEKEHYRADDIMIMGDSAGGGLSLCTLLKIRELELPQPMCAVLLSPWTDLSASGETMHTHADIDPLLPPDKVREWGIWYAGTPENLKNPLVSPVFASLHGLAPMFIQVGTDEILLSDATRVAKNAQNVGTYVELDIWNGMPHVWQMGWRYLPEAQQAIKKIITFVDNLVEQHSLKSGKDTSLSVAVSSASKSAANGWRDSLRDAVGIGTAVLKGLFNK